MIRHLATGILIALSLSGPARAGWGRVAPQTWDASDSAASAFLSSALASEWLAADWIANPADNICGLRDLRTLSNPSRVDFDVLRAATAEMERMRKDSIDPNSPEGVQLRQAAVDRVNRACDAVRSANGYCSVWKAIRHKDDRVVPDITESVRVRLKDVAP